VDSVPGETEQKASAIQSFHNGLLSSVAGISPVMSYLAVGAFFSLAQVFEGGDLTKIIIMGTFIVILLIVASIGIMMPGAIAGFFPTFTKEVPEGDDVGLAELGFEKAGKNGRIRYRKGYQPPALLYDLTIVPHGTTDANARGVYHGRSNRKSENRLNKDGRDESTEGALVLWGAISADVAATPDDFVFMKSPLRRAGESSKFLVDTANKESNISLAFQVDLNAKEIDFGNWDGKSIQELDGADRKNAQAYRDGNVFVRPENGESFVMFLARVRNHLEELNEKYKGKHVVLYGHGTFTKAVQILMRTPAPGSRPVVERRKIPVFRGLPLHFLRKPETKESTAAIFGAGAIARSFIAPLFLNTPYKLLFLGVGRDDKNMKVVKEGYILNRFTPTGEYKGSFQRLKGDAKRLSEPMIVRFIADADLRIVTSLRQDFETVTEKIARAVEFHLTTYHGYPMKDKDPPFNIIFVSNQYKYGAEFRNKILEKVVPSLKLRADAILGVSPTLVDQISPTRTIEERDGKNHTERAEWVPQGPRVESQHWRGGEVVAPPVPGLVFEPDLVEEYRKKLFTINMAQALAVYIGYQNRDPVSGREGQGKFVNGVLNGNPNLAGRIKRTIMDILELNYRIWEVDPDQYADEIMSRLSNSFVDDPLTRSGRSPLSKLSPNNRLIGPAIQLLENNKDISTISHAIAATFLYDNPEEGDSQEFDMRINGLPTAKQRKAALKKVLLEISQLDREKHDALIEMISAWYEVLRTKRQINNDREKIGLGPLPEKAEIRVVSPTVYRVEPVMDGGISSTDKITSNDFVANLKNGDVELEVISHIKRITLTSPAHYLMEMSRLCQAYNGNVSFTLVIEEAPALFSNDMPSFTSALVKAIDVLGDQFFDTRTIHITDGGRKTRNSPNTQLFGFQGLMPFSSGRSYLEEIMIKTGELLERFPEEMAKSWHATVASDSIIDYTGMTIPGQAKNKKWTALEGQSVLSFLVPTPVEDFESKALAKLGPNGEILYVLGKPDKAYYDKIDSGHESRELMTLPFGAVWEKKALSGFLAELSRMEISEDSSTTDFKGSRPALELAADYFRSVYEPLYTPEDQSQYRNPSSVTPEDWQAFIGIVRKHLGQNGEGLVLATGPEEAFIDEGHLQRYRDRIAGSIPFPRDGRIVKDPGVVLAGGVNFRGDKVHFKGNGTLILGKNVSMENVTIELDNGKEIRIPDGFVLRNPCLKNPEFDGKNGFVHGVNQWLGNSLAVDVGVIKGESQTSMVFIEGRKSPVLVSIPFGLSSAQIAKLEFGYGSLSLHAIHQQGDLAANRQMMTEIETKFPDGKQEREYSTRMSTTKAIERMVLAAIGRQKPGKRLWVTIEGIQGASKSTTGRQLVEELIKRGKNAVLIEEDWWHKDRTEREALKEADPDSWWNIRQSWHRWEKYRQDLRRISEAGIDKWETLTLDELYVPETGKTETSKDLNMHPDTIIVHTGFYLSDQETCETVIAPDRLKIVLDLSSDDSLEVKKRRDTAWRTVDNIEQLDRDVYRPNFENYTALFDPAGSADLVFRPQIDNYEEIVRVHQEQPFDLSGSELVARLTANPNDWVAAEELVKNPSFTGRIIRIKILENFGRIYLVDTKFGIRKIDDNTPLNEIKELISADAKDPFAGSEEITVPLDRLEEKLEKIKDGMFKWNIINPTIVYYARGEKRVLSEGLFIAGSEEEAAFRQEWPDSEYKMETMPFLSQYEEKILWGIKSTFFGQFNPFVGYLTVGTIILTVQVMWEWILAHPIMTGFLVMGGGFTLAILLRIRYSRNQSLKPEKAEGLTDSRKEKKIKPHEFSLLRELMEAGPKGKMIDVMADDARRGGLVDAAVIARTQRSKERQEEATKWLKAYIERLESGEGDSLEAILAENEPGTQTGKQILIPFAVNSIPSRLDEDLADLEILANYVRESRREKDIVDLIVYVHGELSKEAEKTVSELADTGEAPIVRYPEGQVVELRDLMESGIQDGRQTNLPATRMILSGNAANPEIRLITRQPHMVKADSTLQKILFILTDMGTGLFVEFTSHQIGNILKAYEEMAMAA